MMHAACVSDRRLTESVRYSLHGADEQEHETCQDQNQVNGFALEVLFLEDERSAKE